MTTAVPKSNGNRLSPERLATLTQALILIDDAARAGLISEVLCIDRLRCRRVLQKLEAQGIVPEHDEVERAALELMAEIGVLRG